MENIIKKSITTHREALTLLESNIGIIKEIAQLWIATLKNNGKLIFFGNGGSAADAQHLAAELVGRFKKNRRPLPAIAISTNTSTMTAIANDFGFQEVFLRHIEALAGEKDLVIGLSTSGNSENIIKAIEKAKELKIKTIGFLGKDGGILKNIVDYALIISSQDTPRIQEMHILAGHILCEIVDENLA